MIAEETEDTDLTLFEDGRLAFGWLYTEIIGLHGVRYCWRCWTAIVAARCMDCGRFTSKEPPDGWLKAAAKTNFQDELEAAIPHAGRTHQDPDDRDDSFWDG